MSGTLRVTTLQDGASAVANLTFDTNGNTTAGGTVAMASSFLRNRIINGAMQIDQRNAGASYSFASTGNQYILDRWNVQTSQASKLTGQQNAGSVTPPTGFINYLGLTSSSAYSVLTTDYFSLIQFIEGFNVADLGWGAAGAASITLSFWVRSSLTGTFGGALQNSAVNRSYPFTYTINSANTWEQKSITIAGDTSGTWLTTSGKGIAVSLGLGVGSTYSGIAGSWAASNYLSATGATSVVGTSGATFYITGVQFEVGTAATPFERRLYGQELMLCQRYYWRSAGVNGGFPYIYGNGFTSTALVSASVSFPVQMRTTPTVNKYGTWTVSGCGQPAALGVDQNGFTLYVSATGATNVACSPSGSTTYLDTSGAEL